MIIKLMSRLNGCSQSGKVMTDTETRQTNAALSVQGSEAVANQPDPGQQL
jgi:hypothetical protein